MLLKRTLKLLLLLCVLCGVVIADNCSWYNLLRGNECKPVKSTELQQLETHLAHKVVGNERQRKEIMRVMEAHVDNREAGALLLLFTGHQGQGKTMMADSIAENLLDIEKCVTDQCRLVKGYLNLAAQVKPLYVYSSRVM